MPVELLVSPDGVGHRFRRGVQKIMGHEDVTTTPAICTDVPADFQKRVEDALVVDPLWIEPVDESENEEDLLRGGAVTCVSGGSR